MIVLYLCWKIPFALGFDWYKKGLFETFWEILLDIWFALDIILNFRTGYVHDAHLVVRLF